MMKGFRRAGADEAPPATTDTVWYGQEADVFWGNHRG